MRQEAGELEYAWQGTYQALIEAAHAEPALRALYPFTSHWALRFSTTTRPRLTIVGPCLTVGSDGMYGVGRGFITPDLGRFSTAHEAVELTASSTVNSRRRSSPAGAWAGRITSRVRTRLTTRRSLRATRSLEPRRFGSRAAWMRTTTSANDLGSGGGRRLT
ncbi:DUF6193 family natural product biosynthesis protein [Streptomyces decoyicus]|uniref:DUF6193 family natural product biosynthesis protein n=1 Tax=Streptomyces decoyicus TaxID=249567 RepID=UPI00345CDDBB